MRLSIIRIRGAGLLLAALTLVAGITTAEAQTRADRRIARNVLSKMHHVNQMEVRLGTLAMRKGQSAQVREYGRRLRIDHRMSDRRVVALASREGIGLRAVPSTLEERRTERRLRYARGDAFDRAFLDAMARGHTQVIQELRQARRDMRYPEVEQLIGNTLPALRQHRNMARDFEDQL